MRLLEGLTFSILLGGIVTALFLFSLRKWLGSAPKPTRSGVPPWLTGSLERLFFTLAVAWDISGVAPAMLAWLALKFATNWNWTPPGNGADERVDDRPFAFSALLAGLVSMFFALVGGRFASGKALW